MVAGLQIGAAEHCFIDPSREECVDASAFYSGSAQQADMEMVCASRPYTTGCSLWRKCRSGLATGVYCESWNVLSNLCSDEAATGAEGCRRFAQLCPQGKATAVRQCTESAGIDDFLQTDEAIEVMMKLCAAMPGMRWCSECTSRSDPAANCKDPLASIAAICLDHYMQDCEPWYQMCKTQPAGLDVICGTSGERPVSDEGNTCFGQMKMYFHGGMTDFVLFDSWVPCSTGRYIGTLAALVFTGIFTGFLKGIRARVEQRWLLQEGLGASVTSPAPAGSWGILPTGSQWRMNLVRSIFVFIVVTLDYAMMLAAMTFNTGIFFAGCEALQLMRAHASNRDFCLAACIHPCFYPRACMQPVTLFV